MAANYDFPAKHEYRSAVWSILARELIVKPEAAHALILPASDGAEISILLSLGFRERHIHCVDRNAAAIARSSWRRKHPAVNYYGVELDVACERIARKGVRLAVANLDLCSNLSLGLVNTVARVADSRAFASDCLIGLAIQKGREPQYAYRMLRRIRDGRERDLHRLAELFGSMAGSAWAVWRLLAWGNYKGRNVPMLWGVASMRSLPAPSRLWLRNQIAGLPDLRLDPNRAALLRLGFAISDLNARADVADRIVWQEYERTARRYGRGFVAGHRSVVVSSYSVHLLETWDRSTGAITAPIPAGASEPAGEGDVSRPHNHNSPSS